MSLLLLSEEEWESNMGPFRRNIQKVNDLMDNHLDFLSKVDESVIRELRKHKMSTQSTCYQDEQIKRYLVLFKNPKFQTQGVLAFNFEKREGGTTITMDLLSINGLPLKLDNKFQAIEICKKLAFSQDYGALFAKFSVGMINRRVKMAIPYFTPYFYNLFENCSQKQKESIILIICKSFLHAYLPFLQSVLSFLVPQQNRKESIQFKTKNELNTQKKEILGKIYRYSQMLVVESQFSESSLQTQKETNQKQRKIQESINALSINAEQIHPDLFKSLSLMGTVLNQQCKLNRFILSIHELNLIKNIIAMPFQPKSKNPYENTMVLNHILINQQTPIQLMKVNDGGFSSIQVGQFRFWYVQSSEGYEYFLKKQNLSPKKLMSKCLAVKNITQGNRQNQIISRSEHQILVLKNIKNGSSIFLPKYYIPINQPSLYDNSVLMDFIPFYNLSSFLATTTLSLSLLSKLYIIFSLVQSLRYIRDYKIVHLDLKPNNVMMFCNMLIKLIDFGQSYHPNVTPISHKPAFSLPYASPQVFQQRPNFTSKSDVFSLGVIIYQILYERYPFNITKQNANLRQQMKQYFKYWYFPPQEYQNYGDMVILRVLNNIISKCLSLDPRQRPQLDWIGVVIRYCFDLIC